jgi:putative addiction module antidote
MRKKLTRTGNSLALVLDKELLERLGIDAGTPLEISTDGRVVVISPVRSAKHDQKLKATMERAHQRYAGVFRKLAE